MLVPSISFLLLFFITSSPVYEMEPKSLKESVWKHCHIGLLISTCILMHTHVSIGLENVLSNVLMSLA